MTQTVKVHHNKRGQKEANGHSGIIKVPRPEQAVRTLNGVHDETHRRANPVILSTPILDQGINTGATGRSKLGVETRKQRVIIGGKTVDRLGTPFGINQSKHG